MANVLVTVGWPKISAISAGKNSLLEPATLRLEAATKLEATLLKSEVDPPGPTPAPLEELEGTSVTLALGGFSIKGSNAGKLGKSEF